MSEEYADEIEPSKNEIETQSNNEKRKIDDKDGETSEKEDKVKKLKTETLIDNKIDEIDDNLQLNPELFDQSPKFEEKLLTFDEDCIDCKLKFRDPTEKDFLMYLHAFSYQVMKKISIIKLNKLKNLNNFIK
jgi:hypothetical protein